MAISTLYIPLFNIEEVILDKDTGLPLAAGVVSFFRDLQRMTPKSVFQISGNPPDYTFTDIGPVLTLGLSGTFVDGSGDPFVPYALPYDDSGNVDLYFVTVVSAGLIPQFTREAVPYIAGTNIPDNQRSSTENELSNPQFVEILFPAAGKTYTVSGSNTVTEVAPDWDIISSGSGTIALAWLQPTAQDIPTNPAYALSITASSGLGVSVTLRQRLTNTPSIMRGQFASGSLVAAVLAGGASNISMTYAPSTGTSTIVIPNSSIISDGSYNILKGNAAIPQQSNDPASTGYIDVLITIPTSRTIAISSIQLVSTETSVNIPYDEQTVGRQKDHLFHYYEAPLLFKPIPSYLVGWDFALNPAQIWGDTVAAFASGTNSSNYVWDQTILFQTLDSGISISRNGDNLYFTAGSPGQGAIIQYLPSEIATQILLGNISVNVRASCAAAQTVTGTVSLWYTTDASLPVITAGTNQSLIATIDANGKPATFHGNWTEVQKSSVQENTFTIIDAVQDFGFNTWISPGPTAASSATFFAIVVGFGTIATTAGMQIISVSLCSGQVPTIPAPQTIDQVLRECQYYYEQSYVPGSGIVQATGLGTVTQVGVNSAPMTIGIQSGSGNDGLYGKSFYQQYKQTKYRIPDHRIWSPITGAKNFFSAGLWSGGTFPAPTDSGGGGTNPRDISSASGGTGPGWTITAAAAYDGSFALCNNTSTIIFQVSAATPINPGDEGLLEYHYTLDSTLGGPIRT